MLSRLLPRPSHFRALALISSKFQPRPRPQPQPRPQAYLIPGRFFSSNGGGDDRDDNWNLSQDAADGGVGPLFSNGDENAWEDGDDVHRPWTLSWEEDEDVLKDFDIGYDSLASTAEAEDTEADIAEKAMRLEREERDLTAILKGSRQSVNDIITASGITNEMIDSLIALKDFEGIEGLPPLEELQKEKGKRKSSEAETERLKQEEAANARTRQVDSKGRAYGTGRRKCSVARVWIQPGDGKFVINEKDFDVYFPILDYRAALLRPFSETKTLGMWDVTCNVKGGGVTGQVGAILLGISRALQNWEPDLRPPLKAVGFLTRDPRMVERKKPGKAKARKSFQWVKR